MFSTLPCDQSLEVLLSYAKFRELPHRDRGEQLGSSNLRNPVDYHELIGNWKFQHVVFVGWKVCVTVRKDIPKISSTSEIVNILNPTLTVMTFAVVSEPANSMLII